MATLTQVVEGVRGCGWRTPGGIYLMSDGVGVHCEALPVPLHVCPTCGHGVKPSRGLTWVEPDALLEGYLGPHGDETYHAACPLYAPGRLGERAGLLWIGEMYYPTPRDWESEGRRMGFSRRLSGIPKGFEIGKTWVLTAHRKGMVLGYGRGDETHATLADVPDGEGEVETRYGPAIFHVWKPDRIEYVVKGDETEEELDRLESRGLSLVQVYRGNQKELMTV